MSLNPKRPTGAIVLAVLALVIVSAGSATAATLITSKQIKDGTIQLQDMSATAKSAWYTRAQSDSRYYAKAQATAASTKRTRVLQSTRAEVASITGTSATIVTAGGTAEYSGNYVGPIEVPPAVTPDVVYWAFDVHAVVQLNVSGATTCQIVKVADGVSTTGIAVTTNVSGPLQLSDSFFTFSPGTFSFDVKCSGNATVPINGARISVIAGSVV